MKARAVREEIELTASELSNNEISEKVVVGYAFDEDKGIIRLISVDEFTGDETLFERAFSEDDQRKVNELIAKNSKNANKYNGINFALVGLIAAVLGSGIPGFFLALFNELSPLVVSSIAFSTLFAIMGISFGAELLNKKLDKIFPIQEPKTVEGLGTLRATQGLKSLITGEEFNLGAPNHESLVEAVKLLNKAWETNESIMKKSARQKEITGVYKTKELQNEQAELERDLAELKQELKDTENEISSILSRYDN